MSQIRNKVLDEILSPSLFKIDSNSTFADA